MEIGDGGGHQPVGLNAGIVYNSDPTSRISNYHNHHHHDSLIDTDSPQPIEDGQEYVSCRRSCRQVGKVDRNELQSFFFFLPQNCNHGMGCINKNRIDVFMSSCLLET